MMRRRNALAPTIINLFALSLALLVVGPSALAAQDATKAKIKDAMSAAPATLAADASIVDWDGTVLREGTNGWTCMPTPPDFDGSAPMCLDDQWVAWAQAWMNKEPVTTTEVGIGYMLAGDFGASNSDPFATDPSAVDDWVDGGSHLMIIVPDTAVLEGLSTDYTTGGPWVMWKGTPYVHIMIPVD